MDAGGAGLQLHAVAAPLLHDLRLLQGQLVDAGNHDAVARLPHVLQGPGHLVILRLHRRQTGQQAHQVAVVPHLKAGLLRQRVVEQLSGQAEPGRRHAGAQVNAGDLRFADVLAGPQGGDDSIHLPDVLELGSALAHRVIEAGLDGVVRRQGVHPGRQEQVQLLHGELVEDAPEDVRHILLPQFQAVHRNAVHLIPGGDVFGDGLRPVALGVHGIQQDDEGLPQLLELPDHPLLRLQIVLPGDVGDGAVRGDDDADGGVL